MISENALTRANMNRTPHNNITNRLKPHQTKAVRSVYAALLRYSAAGLICVLCYSAFIVPKVFAKDYTFIIGNWRGQAHFHEDGRFRSCTMFADYKSGAQIFFVVDENMVWALGINNKGLPDPTARVKQARVQIDLNTPYEGKVKVLSDRGFSILFDDPKTVLNNIKRGYQMIIRVDEFKARFELKGTNRAIKALLDCALARSSFVESPKRNPKRFSDGLQVRNNESQPNPIENTTTSSLALNVTNIAPQALSGTRVEREKAIEFVKNLFKRKGIVIPEFIPQDQHPAGGYDVMWQSNNILWGISILKDANEINIDNAVGKIIGQDAALCANEFASAKKVPKSNVGRVVRQVSTVCDRENETYEVQYSLIKSEAGTFLNIAQHITIAQGKEQEQTAQQRDFLINPDKDIFDSIR